jgi:heme-degrading monooxygenase HmoA
VRCVEGEPRDGIVLTTSPARPDEELVTVQDLTVTAGREEEFVARFKELDVLRLAAEAAAGDLIEAVLLQEGQRFLVVTSWASRAGIGAWIASPARERVRAELEPFYERPAVVNGYPIRSRYPSDPREGSS